MFLRHPLILLVLTCFYVPLSAQTIIPGGDVSGAWDAAGSPYLVQGQISIPASAELSIEPGVEVRFEADAAFMVYGYLYAEGTEAEQILFHASGEWLGLQFIDAPDSSRLVYCEITDGDKFEATGGGIYCENSNVAILYCRIHHNIAFSGGGIGLDNSSPLIYGCEISYNEAHGDEWIGAGGGIVTGVSGSAPVIVNCTFKSNAAYGGMNNGGGVYLNGGVIEDCLFIFNHLGLGLSYGAAIYMSGVTVINCTIVNNSSSAVTCSAVHGSGDMVNSIVWDNQGTQVGSGIAVTYSDIMGGMAGTGNINADPRFSSIPGSYQLQPDSPCIDAGHPDAQYIDPDGTVADMGAFYYPQYLVYSTTTLDFGGVAIGSTSELPLTLFNQSDSLLILHDIMISGENYSTNWNPADSLLSAGASLDMVVYFSPTATIPYNDSLWTEMNQPSETIVELSGYGYSSGATVVPGGSVAGIWTAAGSPYLVQGDIVVPGGQVLTITEGVDIIFEGEYHLMVNGCLTAEGTEIDSIRFTAADTAAGWRGVRFETADDECLLSYCILEYGNTPHQHPEGRGGAIYAYETDPEIRHCSIRNNHAMEGGGIALYYSTATISDCDIRYNTADQGGGIRFKQSSYAYIDHCTISNNQAFYYGGGINGVSWGTISHCEITGNSAGNSGGGFACYSDDVDLINCTFSGNEAENAGAGIYTTYDFDILNSIIWANGEEEIDGPPNVTYSDVLGGWPGEGNIAEDPLFVNAAAYDFHLQEGSPCIDTGDPASPRDPDSSRADMGAYYYEHYAPILVVSDSLLDYEAVLVGTQTDLPLTISNSGLGNLIIHDLYNTLPTFSTNYSPDDSIIAPGEELSIQVYCHPLESGFFDDHLTIETNIDTAAIDIKAMAGNTLLAGGNYSGTWAQTGSPYLVDGDITVPLNQTLIIDPGVIVIFRDYYKLRVTGSLQAVGTYNDSIVFMPDNAQVRWRGIRLNYTSGASHLKYCHITQGKAQYVTSYEEAKGGGIYCLGSDLEVEKCTIDSCTATFTNYGSGGGGIYIGPYSTARITGCNVRYNNSESTGGGGICSYSDLEIINCIVNGNDCSGHGGGIALFEGGALVNCIISNNFTYGDGGGVYATGARALLLSGCIIGGNSAGTYLTGSVGGGIHVENADSIYIDQCIIYNNFAHDEGGGISVNYCQSRISNCLIYNNEAFFWTANAGGGGVNYWGDNSILEKCTIVDNYSGGRGGGVCGHYTSLTISNSIVRQNEGFGADNQIYVYGDTLVSYCNVEGGYPGIGNIDIDPAYIDSAWHDYRLSWGSHCIDAGNPDPRYNDPDSTRADIGAFFYDQAPAARIVMTPHAEPLLEFPPEGGSIDFTCRLTNIDPMSPLIQIWTEITAPGGTLLTPWLGPVQTNLTLGQTLIQVLDQHIPASAPGGMYTYTIHAVAHGDTSSDQFTFIKYGGRETPEPLSSRAATGLFDTSPSPVEDRSIPDQYCLLQNYPNPFNPTTTIRFGLPEAGQVKLTVYNITGQKVADLVDGWRDAGWHEVVFDGLNLSSGLYIYRLTTGSSTASRKMLLVK